jgi:hypothetical protein
MQLLHEILISYLLPHKGKTAKKVFFMQERLKDVGNSK